MKKHLPIDSLESVGRGPIDSLESVGRSIKGKDFDYPVACLPGQPPRGPYYNSIIIPSSHYYLTRIPVDSRESTVECRDLGTIITTIMIIFGIITTIMIISRIVIIPFVAWGGGPRANEWT